MNTTQRVSFRSCSHTGCGCTSEAALESKRLCRRHFIEACYMRLDQIAEQIGQKKLQGSVPESVRTFLGECTSQVTSEALCARQLNNLERSRLLHILLFAADLMNQLRRSGRIPRLVPVRLINDPQSDTWIEDTVTQDLSKHGAMLRCTHPYAKGETLGLVRLDTGDRAIARVGWRERDKVAPHKRAVGILNRSNVLDLRGEARGPTGRDRNARQ